jgi:hypothetical protein
LGHLVHDRPPHQILRNLYIAYITYFASILMDCHVERLGLDAHKKSPRHN